MLSLLDKTVLPVHPVRALDAFPQDNELDALIPYSDQRLESQITKLYVVLSVLMFLLICGLVVFFLFLVEDGGISKVQVWIDKKIDVVYPTMMSTLKITNSSFYSISMDSLISQVQYMNIVIGTQQQTNVPLTLPLSKKKENFTVRLELGRILSYLYNFCTLPAVMVHNIVVFVRTSVTFSYIDHTSQSSLETCQ